MFQRASPASTCRSCQTLGAMKAALLLLFVCLPCAAAPSSEALRAASRAEPHVLWQLSSVVEGDFTCRGKPQTALLGATKSGFAVAVFTRSLKSRPDILRFEPDPRSIKSLNLMVDDLDFANDEYWQEVSALAPGLQASKTCKGLAVSDGEVDSLHIYWNVRAKRFEWWSF